MNHVICRRIIINGIQLENYQCLYYNPCFDERNITCKYQVMSKEFGY